MAGNRPLNARSAIAALALALSPASSVEAAGTTAIRVLEGSVGPAAAGAPSGLRRLSSDSRLGDLLDHPAFAGHAKLLLPWDDRPVDPEMRLDQIGTLLPYHSNVNTADVAAGLNRLIEDAAAGHRVFYDIYDETAKAQDPSLQNTGLFYIRGGPGAPFALIAPGGGFSYVGSVHEGFPYADAIGRAGYNAFVLRYRVGAGGAPATRDLAAALSWIIRHSDELGVIPAGYSLWGSSAGARMAASIGSHGSAAFGGDSVLPPSTVVMAYTSHSDISAREPPTFVVVGERDGIAPPAAMERRVNALRQQGVPVEFHVYSGVGHGFGLGTGTSAEGWVAAAISFWKRHHAP
jgi:acetyl esterase/lipase